MRSYSLTVLVSCFVASLLALVVEADSPAEPDFVVAAMRVQPKAWDKAHNFALLERYAKEAADKGAKLVVTCEGFMDGYTSNPKSTPDTTRERFFEIGEPLDGPWLKRVGELARELKIYLSIGFAERRGDNMHNSVAVFSPAGEVVLRYSKTHCLDEPFYTPGNEFPVAATDLGTLGALICYDRRFPEVPRILALKGAQNPVGSRLRQRRRAERGVAANAGMGEQRMGRVRPAESGAGDQPQRQNHRPRQGPGRRACFRPHRSGRRERHR